MLLWNNFFGLLMDPLLKSNCPIPIFCGLGGRGLIFLIFGSVIEHIVLTYVKVSRDLEYLIFFLKKLLWGPMKVKFRLLWPRWS